MPGLERHGGACVVQEREAGEAREAALAALEERCVELGAAAGEAGAAGGAAGELARAQQRLRNMEVCAMPC